MRDRCCCASTTATHVTVSKCLLYIRVYTTRSYTSRFNSVHVRYSWLCLSFFYIPYYTGSVGPDQLAIVGYSWYKRPLSFFFARSIAGETKWYAVVLRACKKKKSRGTPITAYIWGSESFRCYFMLCDPLCLTVGLSLRLKVNGRYLRPAVDLNRIMMMMMRIMCVCVLITSSSASLKWCDRARSLPSSWL